MRIKSIMATVALTGALAGGGAALASAATTGATGSSGSSSSAPAAKATPPSHTTMPQGRSGACPNM